MKPRDTTAGRAYLDLKAVARQHGRSVDELLRLYALEGFLTRLAISRYSNKFVLKGGVLLAAFEARRPTQDVDFLARRLSGDTRQMLTVVQSIAETEVDDGLIYDTDAARVQEIRETGTYPCVRVSLTAELFTAQLSFHVDISVGDPVWPDPRTIDVPKLLGGYLQVTGYPLVMVLAEKISACIQLGTRNTRWRDFADIWTLTHHHDVNGLDLCVALGKATAHRRVTQEPLNETLAGFGNYAQGRWSGWRSRMNLEATLPGRFGDVLAEVTYFADPVITGDASGLTWDAMAREWRR
jgi:Nucleotidyl transferase AbiEii toxin, Type IV TA system